MTRTVYLDSAAATPVDSSVLAAMRPYFGDQFYNPSATYLPARAVSDALQEARRSVASSIGVRSEEIIFTAGASEANNLAIHGLMRQFPAANMVISAIEHESVMAPAGRYNCKKVAVTPEGTVVIDQLVSAIDEHTVLVSVMYANNEIGAIQPLKRLSQELQKIRQQRRGEGNNLPLYFHTDAAQASNYLDIHASRLGVDLMSLNGGKMYGPKQSGALYIRAGLELQPLIDGGGQERGLRSGTENIAGCIGFAAALQLAQSSRHAETKRLHAIQQQFIHNLRQMLPDVRLNGGFRRRLPNNLNLFFPGQDNERLLLQLEQQGILAASGSACSASSTEPSHVLRAIGRSADEARSSIRLTMGRTTSNSDMDYVLQKLVAIVR